MKLDKIRHFYKKVITSPGISMNEILIEKLTTEYHVGKNLRKMDINIGHSGYYALKNHIKPFKIYLLGG